MMMLPRRFLAAAMASAAPVLVRDGRHKTKCCSSKGEQRARAKKKAKRKAQRASRRRNRK